MSDENTKSKARGGPGWTEHEVLVYLLSAIESSNVQINFMKAPAPVGRNANGCAQKINKVKIALRAEIDAIKNGEEIEAQPEATPKKPVGRKRKAAATEENGDDKPKKRGRAKKSVSAEEEEDVKTKVKDELDDELSEES